MAKRGQPCDCCGAPRPRWQRLCADCFRALPPYLRNPVLETWRRHDKPAHRAAKRAATDWFATRARSHVRAVAPTEAYRNTARLLGERE